MESARVIAIAVVSVCAALTAAQLFPYLDTSGRTLGGGAQPQLLVGVDLDPTAVAGAVVLPCVAVLAFFAAVAVVYLCIHNGGGGGGGSRNRRIPEVVYFMLSMSIGLLVVGLVPYPGAPIDDGAQAPSLRAVAFHALLPSATSTFFLSMVLVYAHVRTGGGGDGPIQASAAVELLAKMTLVGATLVTLTATVLAC